jgi:hypothetical protein
MFTVPAKALLAATAMTAAANPVITRFFMYSSIVDVIMDFLA